jgi:CRP-like cAMP-binding protein
MQPVGERHLNAVLERLTEHDRRAVMAAGEAVVFQAGETFFDVGDTLDRVYFIVSGAVSTTVPMRDGSAVEVMLVGREGAIGFLAAQGPVTCFSRVRAETPGSAIVVPSARFGSLAQERPQLQAVVNDYVLKMVATLAHSAACNAVHKLEPRLAKALLRFQDRMQADELSLTQEQMSRMLGVSRTTLNAVAQAMQAKGVVRYTRGRIGILKRPKLEALACECYRRGLELFREGPSSGH